MFKTLGIGSDLAAFQLSMIAPVNKSVNHSRTVASMRETGWEQQQHQEVHLPAIRQCEVNSLLVLLVIAFFAVTNFFRGDVELTFSFLLVLRFSLHAVYYAKRTRPVNSHCSSMPDLLTRFTCPNAGF